MRGPLHASARRGVTFIEVMVALVIMMLVGGAVSRLLVRSWQSEEVTNDQNLAQKTAQQAVDAIVDRLRAGAMVTSGDENEITIAFGNGDTLTYRRVDHALQRTLFFHDTGQIITETAVPDFLTGLTFEYWRSDDQGWESADTAAAADLVAVSVNATSGKCHATEASFVALRNRT